MYKNSKSFPFGTVISAHSLFNPMDTQCRLSHFNTQQNISEQSSFVEDTNWKEIYCNNCLITEYVC
jgi:hypothetical protein